MNLAGGHDSTQDSHPANGGHGGGQNPPLSCEAPSCPSVRQCPPESRALQGLCSISLDLFKAVTWGLFGLLYKRHLISSLCG